MCRRRQVERPYGAEHRYVAFVDPSGGSSDSMTLAIGHREKDITVVDVVREIVAPFDPESATEEFARTLRGYNITRVIGDREWVRQSFEKRWKEGESLGEHRQRGGREGHLSRTR